MRISSFAMAVGATVAVLTAQTPPTFEANGVVNAASYLGNGISPGSIVSIFGTGLTKITGIVGADHVPLPSEIAGTRVLINGAAAPLFAVANVNGQEQINLQVPWETPDYGSVTVTVERDGLASAPVQVRAVRVQPGIFTLDGNMAVAVHSGTGDLVTEERPARLGEILLLYATGLGEVNPVVPTGAATALFPLSAVRNVVNVGIGGKAARVQWAGLTPYFVALYQVNAEVPTDMPEGMATIELLVQGEFSRAAKMPLEAPPPTVTFADRDAFLAATGAASAAGFDDLPSGTAAPFTSNGVQISAIDGGIEPVVSDGGIIGPHSYWFTGGASPPNFLDTTGFRATFPGDSRATGFDFTCFACDGEPNATSLIWRLLSANGEVVGAGAAIYDFSSWNYSKTHFFGVQSDTPFRSLEVTRTPQSNWFADDLRYLQ